MDTTLFGCSGIGRSLATVREEDLPEGSTPEQVEREIIALLSGLLEDLYPYLAARSAVSAPAVVAGLGIAAHEATSWSRGGVTSSELRTCSRTCAGSVRRATGRTWRRSPPRPVR
ncbi:hypothetical protein ACQEU3_03480 [Spirillospora sp. CA-253888]